METLFHDFSHAFRRLTQNPGFTAVALLSLALGIGANSALFSVANALLLRPLPFKDADRVAIMWNRSTGLNVAQDWFSWGQYPDSKLENRSFEAVAIARDRSFNLTGQGQPEYVEDAVPGEPDDGATDGYIELPGARELRLQLALLCRVEPGGWQVQSADAIHDGFNSGCVGLFRAVRQRP